MSETVYTCTAKELIKIVGTLLDVGLVPFIQSSPGIGKSSIVRYLSNYGKLKLIDHRMSTSDITDFNGLPGFKDGFAQFHPFEDIFPLAHQEIPTGYNGWLLHFDEFNSASKAVQAASYKVILDRQVGQHDLHPACVIVCCGNKASDKAIVNSLSTAMQSRLVHLELRADFDSWLEMVAIPENYHPTIVAYLSAYQSDLMDFSPNHSDKTFCCPRTWEFLNKQVKATNGPVDWMAPAYAGTITSGIALKYVQFCKVFDNLVTVPQILRDPLNAPVPSDMASRWAVMCMMAEKVDDQNFAGLAEYADRFPLDVKVLFFRMAIKRNPELRRSPAYTRAAVQISKYLFD